jgi:hypothetical protein
MLLAQLIFAAGVQLSPNDVNCTPENWKKTETNVEHVKRGNKGEKGIVEMKKDEVIR